MKVFIPLKTQKKENKKMGQKKINSFQDNFQGYLELASAIVERAVKDYVQCGWRIKNIPEPQEKRGIKYCKYQAIKRDFDTAKYFLEDPVGLIQEIFGGDDQTIEFIKDSCRWLADKGIYDTKKNGEVITITKKKKTGEVITEPVKVTTLLLNKYILALVYMYRDKLGLDALVELN